MDRSFLDSDFLEWPDDTECAEDAQYYVEFKYFKQLYKLYRPCAPPLTTTDLTHIPRLRLEKKNLTVPRTLRKYRTLWCIGCRPSMEVARFIFPVQPTHEQRFHDFLTSDYLQFHPDGVPSRADALDDACENGNFWYMPKKHFDTLYTEFQQRECNLFTTFEKLTSAQLRALQSKKFCVFHGRLYDPHLNAAKNREWVIGIRQNPSRAWTKW